MSLSCRAAAVLLCVAVSACSDGPVAPSVPVESGAGQWHTWVLASGSAVRPQAPSADQSAQSQQELDEIVRLQSARTATTDSLVRFWDTLPTERWHALTLDVLEFYWALLPDVRPATPVRSARILALVNVAMYDALVATWDAKYAYKRRAPAASDSRVRPLVAITDVPSYPSEHAAVAAAWAQGRFGQSGIAVLLLIIGSMDVDVAIVTLGGLPAEAISPLLAAMAICGTVSANMAVKIGITLVYAGRKGVSAAIAMTASVVVLAAMIGLAWMRL